MTDDKRTLDAIGWRIAAALTATLLVGAVMCALALLVVNFA